MAEAVSVLLFETHEDSRLIYAAALRHSGMEVISADCTAQVLELARVRLPSMVVMELSLPASGSWALAAALRQEPATARVPLVGLGSTGLAEHRERALALGCRSFLLKPVSPSDLLAEVRRVLAEGRPR